MLNKLIHRYISKAVKENGARPLVGVEPPDVDDFTFSLDPALSMQLDSEQNLVMADSLNEKS